MQDSLTTPGFAPKARAYWIAATVAIIADFVTKRIVEGRLTPHFPVPVLGDWVRMTLTYNTGAAMNVSFGGFSRVGFSVVAVVMVGVLYRMYRGAPGRDVWQALALGLVTGGAIGNLVDRLRSARGVVDFIDVGFPDGGWRFYIFNVADSAVSIGAVLLAIILFRRTEDAPVSTGDAAGPRALASPPAAASPSTDQPAAAD